MSAIIRLAKARPIAFGMGYSLMKTSGCDFMVQKVVEKREQIDWRRNVAFGSFGLFYLGGVQYFIYVPLFSRLFPNAASFAAKTVAEKVKDARGIRDLVAQVFLDQAVHHPLMYFPVFYMIKDFVTSDSPNPVRAVSEYAGNIKEDLVALWKARPPLASPRHAPRPRPPPPCHHPCSSGPLPRSGSGRGRLAPRAWGRRTAMPCPCSMQFTSRRLSKRGLGVTYRPGLSGVARSLRVVIVLQVFWD